MLPWNVEIVEVLGGGFMVLVGGFQWSETGEYNSSGAGNSVYETKQDAESAYLGRTK